eukprot:14881423-Alexandrium_andersonii.AAC.1
MAPRSGGRSAGRPWPTGWERRCALRGGSWGRASRSLPSPPQSAALGPRRFAAPCLSLIHI